MGAKVRKRYRGTVRAELQSILRHLNNLLVRNDKFILKYGFPLFLVDDATALVNARDAILKKSVTPNTGMLTELQDIIL